MWLPWQWQFVWELDGVFSLAFLGRGDVFYLLQSGFGKSVLLNTVAHGGTVCFSPHTNRKPWNVGSKQCKKTPKNWVVTNLETCHRIGQHRGTNIHLDLHLTGHLELPVSLMCLLLDCGRNLERRCADTRSLFTDDDDQFPHSLSKHAVRRVLKRTVNQFTQVRSKPQLVERNTSPP